MPRPGIPNSIHRSRGSDGSDFDTGAGASIFCTADCTRSFRHVASRTRVSQWWPMSQGLRASSVWTWSIRPLYVVIRHYSVRPSQVDFKADEGEQSGHMPAFVLSV